MRHATVVRRARELVGTRYALQGRDPARGIDCIGVVLHSFAIGARGVPDDYRLSTFGREEELLAYVGRFFRTVPPRRVRPGHLVVMRFATGQIHLGILTGDGIVHADVRRRRIIESAIPAGASIVGHFGKRRATASSETMIWRP